jgi:hypothetical protein
MRQQNMAAADDDGGSGQGWQWHTMTAADNKGGE